MTQLTGKTRYRIEERWFKKPLIVLQVQYEYKYQIEHLVLGVQTKTSTDWRDALLEDLTELELITLKEII